MFLSDFFLFFIYCLIVELCNNFLCWLLVSYTLELFSFSLRLFLQVKTTAQLDAALSFLATTGSENLDLSKFEEACGVGMVDKTLAI